MRHRKRGRHLGRTSSHRKALFRNLASSLFLTERDAELEANAPAKKGRIITTLQKAKEVRPLVERCITLARRAQPHMTAASQFGTTAERGSEAWKQWRTSPQWRQWAQAMAPALALRRRAFQILGDKQAVGILFRDLGPRFASRPGGYTRILKLAKPRLGDAGARAILELVGDPMPTGAQRPAFDESAAT